MSKLSPTIALIALVTVVIALVISIALAVQRWRQASEMKAEDADPELVDDEELAMQSSGRGLVGRMAGLIRPVPGSADYSELKRLLFHAGRRGPKAVDDFSERRVVILVSAMVAAFLLVVLFGQAGFILVPILVGGGLLGPKMVLSAEATGRQERIELAMPAVLDLLEACIEAGLSLEQALARVAAEMSTSAPEISDELAVLVGEIRAGRALDDAFRKLSDRVAVDEVKTLCSVLIQASSLGAPLSNTLKQYSQTARKRRSLFLEEKAGKITAGLTLPLTICLLPSALIIVIGPAFISVLETFGD